MKKEKPKGDLKKSVKGMSEKSAAVYLTGTESSLTISTVISGELGGMTSSLSTWVLLPAELDIPYTLEVEGGDLDFQIESNDGPVEPVDGSFHVPTVKDTAPPYTDYTKIKFTFTSSGTALIGSRTFKLTYSY